MLTKVFFVFKHQVNAAKKEKGKNKQKLRESKGKIVNLDKRNRKRSKERLEVTYK